MKAVDNLLKRGIELEDINRILNNSVFNTITDDTLSLHIDNLYNYFNDINYSE